MRRVSWLAETTATCLAIALAPTVANSTTIPVPTGAHPTIQAGIDAAGPGDSVVVSCGTYSEPNLVMKSGVTLISETGLPDCVTLGLPSGDTNDGVRFNNCDDTTVFEGFTIEGAGQNQGEYHVGIALNASSSVIRNCRIVNWSGIGPAIQGTTSSDALIEDCTIEGCGGEYHDGGGFRFSGSSPTVRRCSFQNNHAFGDGKSGGAIACGGPSAALIEDCTFVANGAQAENGPAVSFGGAISCGDQTVIRDCVFQNNDAEIGSGVYATGTVLIAECTFEANQGGAVHAGGGSPTVELCTIVGNMGDEGAGVSVTSGSLTVTDTRITGNVGKYSNVHAEGATLTLQRCTIADNDVSTPGGISGVKGTSAAIDVEQCIVLNPCGIKDVRIESSTTLHLTCTDYDPSRLANAASTVDDLGANFYADPLFCDPAACQPRGVPGNYGLAGGSPCLAANSPCGLLVGAFGQACVGTAVAPETWAGIKAKYRD